MWENGDEGVGGGGSGGGGECPRITVLRSRVYPLGQLPTINRVST